MRLHRDNNQPSKTGRKNIGKTEENVGGTWRSRHDRKDNHGHGGNNEARLESRVLSQKKLVNGQAFTQFSGINWEFYSDQNY